MFHSCGSVSFLVACSSRAPNPLSFNKKIFYRRLIQKRKLFHFNVYGKTSFGEVLTFHLHRLNQTWFSGWLAQFEAKFHHNCVESLGWRCLPCQFPSTSFDFFEETHWRASVHLAYNSVFLGARNSWPARPFSLL